MTIQVQKELNFATGKGKLDIDLTLDSGTLLVITGPSGSGKTTLLRILAGLERATGKIIINGKTWLDSTSNQFLPPQRRKVGMVFQQYALFPNMTVRQNLTYALEQNQSTAIIEELLAIMELSALANHVPFRLSGGQQQRVALARAIVRQPDLLLLDEPLSALDDDLRTRLQDYILKIHQQFQLTTILVSHDLGEIFKMADRVVVLGEGSIQKMGPSASVFFDQPASAMQLVGKVISIEQQKSSTQALVKVGQQLLRLPILDTDLIHLKMGDTVLLSSNSLKISKKK